MPGGRLGIAVGDVVGRGIKAAATMGQLRNALRACAYDADGPADALDRLHALLEGLGRPTFATVVHLVLDPAAGVLDFASAGHLPPLVLRASGEPEFAEPPRCPPIGAPWTRPAGQTRLELRPGDVLLLYTDGLIEERDRSLDDGLADLRRAAAGAPGDLDALADHVLAELLAGRDGTDDVALLAVRRGV
jgi:serine phosphatase RsbU (regulator of sigma subunit)